MKTNLHISLILMGLILYIFIPVNSNAQLNWDKYEYNPVMTVQPGTWYSWNVFFPVVIFEDDMFKMWFCGNNETPGRHIGYAESSDGIEWYILNTPVIASGDPGPWALHLYPGSVLSINDTLRMWFAGLTNSSDNGSIGYAWSVGDHNWNIHPEPVLEAGPGDWDNTMAIHPSVYYDSIMTMYHMFYTGVGETLQIGYATSVDGINWEKYSVYDPLIPVGLSGSFYDSGLWHSRTIMVNDTLRMFFTGDDGTTSYPPYYSFWRIGYAWSTDYINWNIHPDFVLDAGAPGEWDETIVGGPSVLVHNGRYKMWYWGDQYNANWEIGYALGDTTIITNLSEQNNLISSVLDVNPSPFNNHVTISYTLHERSRINLEIYNYNGQKISTLVNEIKQPGKHEVKFEGKELKSGVYFCVLKTNEGIQTKKMIKL